MSPEIGITISCYRGDLPLLKGCLESIRTHIGAELPICLIMHGEFETRELVQAYGVQLLREWEVDPRLRAHSYGYGYTKMVAFWYSPFRRFLHVDPDTVCWGNFLNAFPWHDFDFIYNEPHEVIDEYIQKSQYFDPEQVFKRYPEFPWRVSPFFSAGIFMARRGILDLEEYLELLAFQRENPTAFLCGEQGILNFMIFRRIFSGTLQARQWPFQAIVPVIPLEELRNRFSLTRGVPAIRNNDQRVIHWAGSKPYLSKAGPFREPMTYYRMNHLRRIRSPLRYLGKLVLFIEEVSLRIALAGGRGLFLALLAKSKRMVG